MFLPVWILSSLRPPIIKKIIKPLVRLELLFTKKVYEIVCKFKLSEACPAVGYKGHMPLDEKSFNKGEAKGADAKTI